MEILIWFSSGEKNVISFLSVMMSRRSVTPHQVNQKWTNNIRHMKMTRWGKIKWFPLSCTSDARNKRLKYFFFLSGKPFLFLAQYYVNLPLLFYPYLKKKQSLKKSFWRLFVLFILFCFDFNFVWFYIPTKFSPPSSPHSSPPPHLPSPLSPSSHPPLLLFRHSADRPPTGTSQPWYIKPQWDLVF